MEYGDIAVLVANTSVEEYIVPEGSLFELLHETPKNSNDAALEGYDVFDINSYIKLHRLVSGVDNCFRHEHVITGINRLWALWDHESRRYYTDNDPDDDLVLWYSYQRLSALDIGVIPHNLFAGEEWTKYYAARNGVVGNTQQNKQAEKKPWLL